LEAKVFLAGYDFETAEKLPRRDVLRGTGFSPYVTGDEELAALAAEGM
jgi:hypothetical protein